jgi:hypothetical protein
MADPGADGQPGAGRQPDAGRQPGWPQVILVAAGVVAIVLGAAALTGLLPTPLQQAIFQGPVLIGVLIVGTAWILWRISHGRPLDGER